MTLSAKESISSSDVRELVRPIFSDMLHLQVEMLDKPEPLPRDVKKLVASIKISGDWAGVVELHTDLDFGIFATAIMSELPEEDITLGEVYDGVGELVNMIGGGIKGALVGSCSLSLPQVDGGAGAGQQITDVYVEQFIPFRTEGHRLEVVVKHISPGSDQ